MLLSTNKNTCTVKDIKSGSPTECPKGVNCTVTHEKLFRNTVVHFFHYNDPQKKQKTKATKMRKKRYTVDKSSSIICVLKVGHGNNWNLTQLARVSLSHKCNQT